jgi:hypothetical protein
MSPLPVTPLETSPNKPNTPPAPGTANVALCNFVGKPTVFKICGTQGAAVVTREVHVPAFSYIWSTGWAAGADRMLTVSTPYYTKAFCPFVTSDMVAIFET